MIYNIFNLELGNLMYIGGNRDPKNRMVEMLHSNTPQSVKKHVMDMFSESDSHLRILVATIAYGMESDDDDDDNSDANVSGYHNEWDDFLNDDSFLSLINQSGCYMQTCSESEQSTVEIEASYPSFLDSVIYMVDET